MGSAIAYDSIIIGSGQGGTPLAVALAKAGRKTAIIEKRAVGGTCVNTGCTPTKTLYASAHLAGLARRAKHFGIELGGVHPHLGEIRNRKQKIVESFRDGTRKQLESTPNLDLIDGTATFTGAKTIEVALNSGEKTTLTAKNIFIDTGGRPSTPQIPGAENARIVDSAALLDLGEMPEHLIVLGGGFIGLEFAQMFARFGAQVTIVQREDQLLPEEDRDVADELAKILRDDGIEILLSAKIRGIERVDPTHFEVLAELPIGDRGVSGDLMLNATGRVPNTDALRLDLAGVEVDERGFIKVDDRLQTNVAGIWAIGDVKGGPALTHISYDDYRVLRANILEGGKASIKGRMVPYTIYTDPQLGRVGLNEKQAQQRELNYRVAKMEMSHVARATESDQKRGFMKALVDKDSGKILGCSVLGMEGGELMSMIQLAMMGNLRAKDLANAIFAHPALAESLNNLFAE